MVLQWYYVRCSKLPDKKPSTASPVPGARRHFLLCVTLIGLCMPAVHVSFGIGAHYLGDALGRTVGWAISIALSLVAGNAVGFITGEWRGVTARSKGFLYAGIVILIVATVSLAFASSLGTG